MAKLSDIFLNILGNTLQGAQGTPAAQEERARAQADLALRQQTGARDNLTTLANVNENYNQLPPGFVGPQNQGSFTPKGADLSSLGIAPGTSFQPISQSKTFAIPNLKTGGISTQTVPIQRGGSVQEVNPFSAALLGQQKAILEQADVLDRNAQKSLDRITQLTAKEDPSVIGQVTQSLAQGILPPSMQFKDPSIANLVQQEGQRYLTFTKQSQSLRDQGLTLLGGGGTSTPTNPPNPAGSPTLGTVRVINKQTGQHGSIASANFNSALYDYETPPTGQPSP